MNMLICPACLPEEKALKIRKVKEEGEDILEGSLSCPRCKSVYPIRDGIAFLDPASFQGKPGSGSKYETPAVLSSYLWSHYADLLSDPEATGAYGEWADLVAPRSGMAIDAGSAVGRFTFEMSLKSEFAVGVDNSLAFVRCARQLMRDRRITMALKEEGRLARKETLSLPEAWDSRRVEFVVADAQALPFRSGAFSSLASLNLVDKLPFPARHLGEISRLAARKDAQFLFSDPFSWSEEAAEEREWLGGTQQGPYAGRGLQNIMAVLTRETSTGWPAWKIKRQGHVWWKIRTHANHFELIRSCYLKAVRD